MLLTPPRALPPNAHIAVLAAGSPSETDKIEAAARHLVQLGHRVTLAENIGSRHRNYLAAPDDERVEIVNRFLRSDEYDAFFFSRGGYGAMRILDRIDWEAIRRNPRPVVGFSDVTAIHQAMATHANVGGFHGPMMYPDFMAGLPDDRADWLWRALRGDAPLTWSFAHEDVLFEGADAEGTLFGGCLSITDALVGTPYDLWVEGGVWFWEDVGEPIYRIDRMLTHLRLSGRMQKIRGVIIGKLKDCGEEAELLRFLREFFEPFGIPVVRNLPFGHYGDNLLMPIGSPIQLSTRDLRMTITEPIVR
ncbi:MAG TPA: LD-carboxypeptidase [Thermoanaerobaculia bacterium]|jgi:muramoyltetrapeptide carboxypeptidase